MNEKSVDDLRILFLETVAKETPGAVTNLFLLRDAGKWAQAYHVSADWLLSFLKKVLKKQEHIDWVLEESDWRRLRQSRGASVKAWQNAIASIKLAQITPRILSRAGIAAYEETPAKKKKRTPSQHCRWLVLWLFIKGMTDEAIRQREHVANSRTIGKERRKLARLIGLDLLSERRGRPPKMGR